MVVAAVVVPSVPNVHFLYAATGAAGKCYWCCCWRRMTTRHFVAFTHCFKSYRNENKGIKMTCINDDDDDNAEETEDLIEKL